MPGPTNHPGYMSPSDLMELVDSDGVFRCCVRGLREELIDRRPQLVMYVDEDPRGIIVSRAMYQDLTKYYGRNAFADEFFRRYGLQ